MACQPGVVKGKPAETTVDEVRYVASMRKQGTHLLTVSAERGGVELWRSPLDYEAVSDQTMVAATRDVVMTYGLDPGKTEVGVLIGLDAKTGAILYQRPNSSFWAVRHFADFRFNGRYLIMIWGFGLHAYEPSTGSRVWNIGGR